MKRQNNVSQIKEQEKSPEINHKDMETSNFLIKNIKKKKWVIRILTKLESRIEELRENFNKDLENIIKN